MISSIIFLAGVHGVGKGHLATHLGEHFCLESLSASTLIKSERNRPIDSSKVTINPTENQDSLVSAINRLDINSHQIILDGHFVLLTDDGFFEVPLDTFKQIPIDFVILKTLDPSTISHRIKKRDGCTINVDALSTLQSLEVKQAHAITKSLNIPLVVIDNDNYDEAVASLKDHITLTTNN